LIKWSAVELEERHAASRLLVERIPFATAIPTAALEEFAGGKVLEREVEGPRQYVYASSGSLHFAPKILVADEAFEALRSR
jgi:hypothetical protein